MRQSLLRASEESQKFPWSREANDGSQGEESGSEKSESKPRKQESPRKESRGHTFADPHVTEIPRALGRQSPKNAK